MYYMSFWFHKQANTSKKSVQSIFHSSMVAPVCFIYPTLIKITAHQMVWSKLRQLSCGGEALTNVPFGAEMRLHRNKILSRNKRLKLSDSSSSRAEQAWKQHSGATESHCGGVTLDQMTRAGVIAHSHSALRWHRTRVLKALLSDRFTHTHLPSLPPSFLHLPPPTQVTHLLPPACLSLLYFVLSPTLSHCVMVSFTVVTSDPHTFLGSILCLVTYMVNTFMGDTVLM